MNLNHYATLYSPPKIKMRTGRSHFFIPCIHKMLFGANFVNYLSIFDKFRLKVRFIV